MLLLKSLISVPSNRSTQWSFFKGKKCFLDIHWLWKALIFQCLPIIADIENHRFEALLLLFGCYNRWWRTKFSNEFRYIPATSIMNDEIPGFKWKLQCGVWFVWMVCCVKLHRLRSMIFALFCSVCLFVCFFCFFFFFGGGAHFSLSTEGHFMLGYYEDYKWSRTVLTFDCLAYNVGLHGFCFYLSLHNLNTSSITIKFLQSFADYAGVLAITN